MKKLGYVLLLLLVAFSLLTERRVSGDVREASECITCHTSARMLIEATREIGRSRPAATGRVESIGEG